MNMEVNSHSTTKDDENISKYASDFGVSLRK